MGNAETNLSRRVSIACSDFDGVVLEALAGQEKTPDSERYDDAVRGLMDSTYDLPIQIKNWLGNATDDNHTALFVTGCTMHRLADQLAQDTGRDLAFRRQIIAAFNQLASAVHQTGLLVFFRA